jgi:hypothetical protein
MLGFYFGSEISHPDYQVAQLWYRACGNIVLAGPLNNAHLRCFSGWCMVESVCNGVIGDCYAGAYGGAGRNEITSIFGIALPIGGSDFQQVRR